MCLRHIRSIHSVLELRLGVELRGRGPDSSARADCRPNSDPANGGGQGRPMSAGADSSGSDRDPDLLLDWTRSGFLRVATGSGPGLVIRAISKA